MMSKVLLLTIHPDKYCHCDFSDPERYQDLDIVVDKDAAMRLLLRNGVFYESILIDCEGFSCEELRDFIQIVRDKTSPVYPKIVAFKTNLPERDLILLGVDEVLKDFDLNSIFLSKYPRLSGISNIAFVEFLIDMIRVKDKSLFDHIKRVKTFTAFIAKLCHEQGLIDGETYQNTVFASFFHDLGKMFIPDNILHKPSRLTQEEFEVIKQHTVLGANLFEKMIRSNPKNNLGITLFQVSKYHHERYDGKGYPCGLIGEQIPLAARIVAIADVFEALISHRSYRAALDFQQALKTITQDQGHFDPVILELFLKNANSLI